MGMTAAEWVSGAVKELESPSSRKGTLVLIHTYPKDDDARAETGTTQILSSSSSPESRDLLLMQLVAMMITKDVQRATMFKMMLEMATAQGLKQDEQPYHR